jgi:hypothetical protein
LLLLTAVWFLYAWVIKVWIAATFCVALATAAWF